MKLYDFLLTTESGTEVTVTDTHYDVESYFYNDLDEEEDGDDWTKSIIEFSKLLTVKKKITSTTVEVNMSELITEKMEEIKKAQLFGRETVEAIMCNIDGIIGGYVSEEWLKRFVNALKEGA